MLNSYAKARQAAQNQLLNSLKRFSGQPIMLGRMNTPLDYEQWRKRCQRVFGAEVPFGEPLERAQLARLGFIDAAVKMETGTSGVTRKGQGRDSVYEETLC